MTDQLRDDVPHQRPHRRDDLTRGLHPAGRAFAALLRRLQQRHGVLRALPVGVRGGTGPRRDVGLDHPGQVFADAAQLGGDVLPRLGLRGDLVGVAGQPVQGLFQ
ncbi:hypothetical protein, partial [Amycolatopsis sp. CA-126428]|uniref:hypothetical protein n=1 Tax=Amycolatopsis sp. CA-126428 TaxID=2073158 RepID=UPI001E4395CE